METVLAMLPLLACPIGMGAMMWLMMRGDRAQAATAAQAVTAPASRGRQWRLGGLCFDWRVLAGLAAVGLAIWVVAPGLVWAALPLLLLAACPLSMLLMMRGMRGGQCAANPVAAASADAGPSPGPGQLSDLREQLAATERRREALTREVAVLQAAELPTPGPASGAAAPAGTHGG